MARPFLADADFVNKAAEGREDEINVCIGCNQVGGRIAKNSGESTPAHVVTVYVMCCTDTSGG